MPCTAPDTLGFLTAHLNDAPPAPSSVAQDISPAWDRLILRLLATDPGDRYGSAAEVADELRALGGPAASTPPVPSPRPGPADTAPSPEAPPTVTATRLDSPGEAGEGPPLNPGTRA